MYCPSPKSFWKCLLMRQLQLLIRNACVAQEIIHEYSSWIWHCTSHIAYALVCNAIFDGDHGCSHTS